MSVIKPTTVEVETSEVGRAGRDGLPVRASLRYDPSDPYAVHVLSTPTRPGARRSYVRARTAGHRAG